MDNQWADVYYTIMGIYGIPEKAGIRFREDGMFIRNVLTRKEALYVEHPAEDEVYKQLDKRRLLVVRGPKGDGLSVATLIALAKKMVLDRAVVVDAVATKYCINDVTKLIELVDSIRRADREPIFYLDISKPGHYPGKPWEDVKYFPIKFEKFIDTLRDIEFVLQNRDVATVVVASDDLYEVLKYKLREHVAVEVHSNDVRFLGKLVQAYSGCGEDVATEVAKAVVAKHDCGRAVLATLVADWLAKHNCKDVAEALKAAEEKAKEFYIDYIWHVVLSGDRKEANLHAPLLLLRHFGGPMSVETAEEFLISLGFEEYKVRGSLAVKWIATNHCSLIEDAIKKAVEKTFKERVEYDLYGALRNAVRDYRKYFEAKGYLK